MHCSISNHFNPKNSEKAVNRMSLVALDIGSFETIIPLFLVYKPFSWNQLEQRVQKILKNLEVTEPDFCFAKDSE